MSTYEQVGQTSYIAHQEYDQALLTSPWLPLPTTPPLILKHTPHPSRPGYIVLLTDLSSVYLEVLTAPSVPSRLNEVQRRFPANGDEVEEDIIAKSERALKSVKRLWDQEVQMELSSHDHHDAILTAQSDDFDWLFYLTEIKGRQATDILAKHLIGPIASILLETNNVKFKGSTPINHVHTLFSSPTIAQHLAKHHAAVPERKESTPEPSEQGEEAEYASEEEPSTKTDTPKSKSKSRVSDSISPAPPSSDRKRHIIQSDKEDTPPSPAPKRQERNDKSPSLPGPTPSQTRKEREKAEEEEMNARAEAMKRKMEGGGGGGGNLGRRRLRR